MHRSTCPRAPQPGPQQPPPPTHPPTHRPAPPPPSQLATSAAIFYGYVFVVGLALYFCVKWFKGELKVVNVFCIYGG